MWDVCEISRNFVGWCQTYKLIDLRIRVYLLLAAVLDGLSEIVALFILADETKTVIEPTVNVFNK